MKNSRTHLFRSFSFFRALFVVIFCFATVYATVALSYAFLFPPNLQKGGHVNTEERIQPFGVMQVYPHSSFECASSRQCSNWPHSDSNRIEFTIRLRESTFALLPARHTRSIDLLRQIQWVCIRRSYYRSNVDSNAKK